MADGGEEAPRGPDGWENWQAEQDGKLPAGEVAEFSYYSDSQFTGELTDGLGPYQLLNAVSGRIQPQAGAIEHVLVVRITIHDDHENQHRRPGRFDEPNSAWEKADTPSYHGGGIGDELGALLALALGVRLRCGGLTRMFGDWVTDPLGRPVEFGHERPPIVTPARNSLPILPRVARGGVALDSARAFLESYPTLGRTDAVALVRAARQYEQAVWVSDADPGISWLSLVGAVETAAVHWREYKKGDVVERLRTNAPTIAEIVEPAGEAILERLAKEIASQLKATDRFRKFLAAFAPPAPTPRPKHAQLDWGDLDRAFAAIYARRSEALHAGKPIPWAMCLPPRRDENGAYEETIGALGVWSGPNYWPAAEVPMYLNSFEYIVRDALLNWWRWLEHRAQATT